MKMSAAFGCLAVGLLVGCVHKNPAKPSWPVASGPDHFEAAQPVAPDGTPYPKSRSRKAKTWFLNGDHRPSPKLPTGAVTLYRPSDEKALPDDTIPSSQAVIDARNAALQEPVASSFVGASSVHPYVEGAVYRVHTAPGSLTTIALQPGEIILELAAGDTARWLIQEASSGIGTTARPLLFVKPLQPGLTNNLTIATSKRVYHLDLESHAKGQYQTEIAWRYAETPSPVRRILPGRNEFATEADSQTTQTNVAVGNLDFGYRIESRSRYDPNWMPVRAYHDGVKTYIEFPAEVTTRPPLFVIRGKESEIVNYRLQGNTYVIDRIVDVAELRLGDDEQTVVRVTRTEG